MPVAHDGAQWFKRYIGASVASDDASEGKHHGNSKLNATTATNVIAHLPDMGHPGRQDMKKTVVDEMTPRMAHQYKLFGQMGQAGLLTLIGAYDENDPLMKLLSDDEYKRLHQGRRETRDDDESAARAVSGACGRAFPLLGFRPHQRCQLLQNPPESAHARRPRCPSASSRSGFKVPPSA